MYRLATLLGVLALALSGCDSGGSTSGSSGTSTRDVPGTIDTDEDFLRAQRALLTESDLGEGWESEDRADDEVVDNEFACFDLDAAGATAEAESDLYTAGNPSVILGGAPFVRGTHVVSSRVNLYQSESRAKSAYDFVAVSLVTQSTGACLLAAEDLPDGPPIAGGKAAPFLAGKFPSFGDESRAADYIVSFKKDKESKAYVDVVVIRDERAVGVVLFSSLLSPPLSQPFSVDYVQDTARVLADRLGPPA
jgi:hypothetical protein